MAESAWVLHHMELDARRSQLKARHPPADDDGRGDSVCRRRRTGVRGADGGLERDGGRRAGWRGRCDDGRCIGGGRSCMVL